MKTLKKLFSVSAIVALLGTLAPMYAFGANYTEELEQAYDYAYSNGITTMTSIDNADMFGSLTRIAMAKMIANYATTVLGLEPDTSAKCTFTDVTAALDTQYDNGVTKACQLGLMGQNITAFRPNDPVTRAEFGTTLSRALNANDADKLAEMNAANPYYKDHLNFLNAKGIMKDISNPSMPEVRGYVMLMMMRSDDSYTPGTSTDKCTLEEIVACALADDQDACLAECNGNDTPVVNPGYAKVTTKAASTQTVALNAVEKKIGTVTLTAGDNDTTVTSLEITKAGLGNVNDIDSIQLMKNGEYVSNQATLSTKKTATLRFTPKLEIKAGKSETFDVVVSLKGTNANGQHDFSVTAVTVANGDFGGTPAKLGSLVTTNYTVANVTGTLVAGTPTYDLNAGDEDVEFAKVSLKPGVEANITAVTFTSNTDELNKKFANVKAYIDDEVVGNVTVNDETITVAGLNETVKANKPLEVVLKGDVIYVGENLTGLTLDVEGNHVTATETNTDERMTSTTNGAKIRVDIKGVDLTLKNLVKNSQTVAPGATDVVLMDLELTAGADLEIQDFSLAASTFSGAWFEEGKVTLYIDGIDYPFTGNKTYNKKSEYFSVSAGDKVSIQVVGDFVDDNTVSFGSPYFTFTINNVKNTETNNVIKGVNKSQKGHTTSVKGGKPTLKDTKVNSSSLLKEGDEADVLGFSVKASNEQITVKSAEFTVSNVGTIKEVALYKEGSSNALVTKEDTDFSGNKVTMSLSQSVSTDTTAKYVLKATMSDGSVTDLGTNVRFTLDRITYTTASNSTATGLTAGIYAGYQLASDEPTFTITKNGNRIEVVATNNSDYDIDGVAFAMKLMGKFVDGNDLLQKALLSGGNWMIKDDNDNVIASGTEVKYTSNKVIAEFPLYIERHDFETFVIEMPEQTTIESDYYTAEERVFGFRYVDSNGNLSNEIKARYNGAAESELGNANIGTTLVSTNLTLTASTGLIHDGSAFVQKDITEIQDNIVVSKYQIKGTIKAAIGSTNRVYQAPISFPFESTTYGNHFIALIVNDGGAGLSCAGAQFYDTATPTWKAVDPNDCTIIVAVNQSAVLKIRKSTDTTVVDEYTFDEADFE